MHQGWVGGVLGWAGGVGVGVCIVNAVSAQFHCEAGESTKWASLFVLPQKSLMHSSPQPPTQKKLRIIIYVYEAHSS